MNENNKILIKINKENLEKEYAKKVELLSKNLKLNGFRKGFIPENIIKKRFEINIKQDLEDEIIRNKISEKIKEEKINIIDNPKIKERYEDSEKNIIYVIQIETFPKIDIDLEKININKYEINITEEDINREINNISRMYNKWEESFTICEKTNKINIDVYEKNEKEIKYILKNENIIINKKNNNLKEKFKNKSKNEEFKIYEKKNAISNKIKEVIIKINEIKKKEEKISIDIIKNIGIDPEKNLKEEIKKKLINFSEILIDKINNNLLLEEIIKFHKFEVPDVLIEKKKEELKDKKTVLSEDIIKKEIKLNLIFLAIKQKFNINIKKEEIERYIKISQKKNIERIIENEIYIKEIIKIIKEKINTKNILINFKDLIKMSNKI